MEKVVPLSKRSKKEQKKLHAARRASWNGVVPVTKIVPNKKAYDRNRRKQNDLRQSRLFRDENACSFSASGAERAEVPGPGDLLKRREDLRQNFVMTKNLPKTGSNFAVFSAIIKSGQKSAEKQTVR